MSLVHNHDGQGLWVGTFLSCGARLSYRLTVGPIFTRMAHTLRPCHTHHVPKSMEQYCSRVFGEGGGGGSSPS